MKFDYSQFPTLHKGYLIVPTPCEELKQLDLDIYERLSAAIYMTAHINGESKKAMISTKAVQSAYLRAALTEFVSLEDLIEQKYSNFPKSDYKFYKSLNPYYHLIKLLRNYNIHLSDSFLDKSNISVSLINEPNKVYDISITIIDNLSVSELKNLTSAKDYTNLHLEEMLVRFDEEQRKFGVSCLLLEGILKYSKQITTLLKAV